MDNTSFDDNILQWCNGNYELVYSSLRHLRKYSVRKEYDVSKDKDSYKLGFFHRFWNKCSSKSSSKQDSDELDHSDSEEVFSDSDEEEELEDLCDPTNDFNLRTNLETLKTAVVECMTKCNFHKPRLVPKRKIKVTKDHLAHYVSLKFGDLLENLDHIEEFSVMCNIDQFLCAELLHEGLYYYGVKDSQKLSEFTIIENMLFKQVYFQLKSLLFLFSFVNKGEFKSNDKFVPDRVFPEALEVLKCLADRGLVKNLFLLLMSSIKETYRFFQAKNRNMRPEDMLVDDKNGMDYLYSTPSNMELDYDLVFRHNALYLNTVLDLLTCYYMAFNPTENDLSYLMGFLPHVFDFVTMFKVSEFVDGLKVLFENAADEHVSSFYPKSLELCALWPSCAQFDKVCNSDLTGKLCNLLLVMLNTRIYRFDQNMNMVRLNESFLKVFRMNPHSLFYRGLFDETFDPNFQLKDLSPLNQPQPKFMERDKLELERFDKTKLRELDENREEHKSLELVVDFVLYGVYMEDSEKILEGFSSNVLEVFLKNYDKVHANSDKLDTNYLSVYNKVVRMVFTLFFHEGESLSKNWYDLLNYEVTCKRKLEELSRAPVVDEVDTAVFREPGTCLIHLLKLFSKVYKENDGEFVFKVYKSVAESYKSLVPNRSTLLFTQDTTKYNLKYYQVNTRAAKLEDYVSKHGYYREYKGTKLYKELHTRSESDYISLSGKELDHLLLFPNRGFSWVERNSALLELVSQACNSRNIFVETYPRLLIQLLEFSVYLAMIPSVASKLPAFLNSGSCKELQFPHLLQRVVTQLKCLNRGDFDQLPGLVYEKIIARDDRIETAEAAFCIATSIPGESNPVPTQLAPNTEDTSNYLQEYFKKPSSFSFSDEMYSTTGYRDMSKYPEFGGPKVRSDSVKKEYLKDVDNYRISNVKQEVTDESDHVNLVKTEQMSFVNKQYTFPVVNTYKEVKKALSNLGLGSTLPFGLVEVSSLIFKLVVTLDPLVSYSQESLKTLENRRMKLGSPRNNRNSREHRTERETKGHQTDGKESSLAVKFGNYDYLDVLFSILSNPYVKGTELLVGSLLKSIASVHVADHKMCKLSLVRLSQLLYDPTSTLGRKLNYYELTNLMYCFTSLLLYLPFQERYSVHSDSDSDYLLDLLKYILNILELEAASCLNTSNNGDQNNQKENENKEKEKENQNKDNKYKNKQEEQQKQNNKKKNKEGSLREAAEDPDVEMDYYTMMNNIFRFLLMVSKGPLGQVNTSRATQYLYEQILLPGSSVAYLLVKCANEAKLTSAVSLVCNVFKRDFLVLSLHNISKLTLNKESKCPNCNLSCNQELVHKGAEKSETNKFSWFLNKIHLIGRQEKNREHSYQDSRSNLRNVSGNWMDDEFGSRSPNERVSRRGDYELEKVQRRVGCEVCCDIDFNQRPLSLLLAHDAFLEALSSYSPDCRCDLVGNLSTRNMELRVKTLYILLQFVNRDCKLYLSNKLLARFKYYFYQSTLNTMGPSAFGDGVYSSFNRGKSAQDEEFYYVINDPDMEASDLLLYNKLKWLTQADYDQMTSFSNLRQLSSCTFKTLVTYFFSVDAELQFKLVDERLFLSMVRACKEPWEENSWYKVYLLAMVAKLVNNPNFSKLLLLSWPTVFKEIQDTEFHKNKYNYTMLMYWKLAYSLELVTSYSRVMNYVYNAKRSDYNSTGDFTNNANQNNQNKQRNLDSDLNSLFTNTFGDANTRVSWNKQEDLVALLDTSNLDYTLLTIRMINNFVDYETMLYNNLLDRVDKFESSLLQKLWNFNSYCIFNDNTQIKLLSYYSMTLSKDFNRGEQKSKFDEKQEQKEEYVGVVEMYNNYLLAFVSMFKRMLRMYESLNFLKFDSLFNYIDGSDMNYEFKFVLQLTIIKRLYKHKQFNLIVNLLIKLVSYLLQNNTTNELLRAKIYHVVNYFIEVTSKVASEASKADKGTRLVRDHLLIPRLMISHFSNSNKPNNLLELLLYDSTTNYPVYHELEVLGHMFSLDNSRLYGAGPAYLYEAELEGLGGKQMYRNNFMRGNEENNNTGDYTNNTNQSKEKENRKEKEKNVNYYRYRCIESLYFALEKKELNCSVEALKLLSSFIKALGSFEATRVEFDSGTLDYGNLGCVSVASMKELVSKRLLANFYLCKSCLLSSPLCQLCTDLLVGSLNALYSVCTLHQFGSFWFSIRVDEHENLSDMFLKCTFMSLFENRPSTEVLLPTLFILEHILCTTSLKTRSSIISWLNQNSDLLLVNINSDLDELDHDMTVYVCCLLRVYRVTFLWLLSDYRAMNEYNENFSLIIADVHCKFPLASTLPRVVPRLLRYFVEHLDSNLNWLSVLLSLQAFFPELGAFEANMNFTSQVPIKTKAVEMVKLLVEVFFKTSNKLLSYIQYYSTYNNYYPNKISINNSLDLCRDNMERDSFEDFDGQYNENLDSLNNILILKVVTLDCCVILLDYILSLVKLPNTVGINADAPEFSRSSFGIVFKMDECDQLRRTIEKLAKVCTANGGSIIPQGYSREENVEFLAPYQLEHVSSFYRQFNYTHKTLFSTLLTSLLNLDSILQFYT